MTNKIENINELQTVYLVQVGDRVTKGSKQGQIVSMNKDKAIVSYDGGVFKEEPLESLTPVQETCAKKYLDEMRGRN